MATSLGLGTVIRVTPIATMFRLESGAHRWVPNAAVDPTSTKTPGQSGILAVRDDAADGTGIYVAYDRNLEFAQGRATFALNQQSGQWTLQAEWNHALSANGKTQIDAIAKFVAMPQFAKG